MQKLLYFASDFQIGLSALLTDQLKSIVLSGIDVISVSGEHEQEKGLRDKLKKEGIQPIVVKGLDSHQDFDRLVKEITSIIMSHDVTTVHVQNNWQLAVAYIAKLRTGKWNSLRIIYTLHGFRHNSPIKSVVARGVIGVALMIGANRIICMTDYLKRNFRALSYKIRLLPLGVSDDFFTSQHETVDDRNLKLIFPAQFRKGKNHDVLIRAFKKYCDLSTDKEAQLILPGAGPLLEDIMSLVREMDLERQVKFPGFVSKSDVKQLYLQSNVAIVSSNSETFGQSIVEPYVLGRCVVSTPVGIALEIIKNGESGFIYKTEYDLVKILLNLKKDLSLLSRIGKRNFEHRDQFRWSVVTEQYKSLII